jgi:galactokinase
MNLADRFVDLTGRSPVGVWQAPGRVNLIGEHTDYNAGWALPFAIDRRTEVAVGRRSGRQLRLWSVQDPAAVRADLDRLERDTLAEWARYPAGVVWAFQGAGVDVPGVDVVVDSRVPIGSGLSSSAALEAAVAVALNEVCRAGLERARLVELCHLAESEFVGVPVGRLDQVAVLCAQQGQGLLIDFRSLDVAPVPLDIGPLVVVDTGVRHRTSDGGYAARRRACERAAEQLGVPALRDATLEEVEGRLDGELRRRARHVVSENDRVLETARRLRDGGEIGELLTASHVSLRDDYEVSCAELDAVVAVALDGGASGARLTGAGFGGCAIVLGLEAGQLVQDLEPRFRATGLRHPSVFGVIPSAAAGPIT